MKIIELLIVASLPFGLAACNEATSGKAVPPRAPALVASVMKSDLALTFAQIRTANGGTATLLVTQLGKERVRAIDVAELGIAGGADSFA
jgi:hypothetical protein